MRVLVYASSARAQAELGWRPVSSDLDTIVSDAAVWRAAPPGGYRLATAR